MDGGWVKMRRKVIEEGQLNLPNTTFKVWVYCLLRAAPFPDASRKLGAGELWLGYGEMQQALSAEGSTMSKNTIAKAIKNLRDKGYIVIEKDNSNRIKAKISNWERYQFKLETVPLSGSVLEPDRYRNCTDAVQFLAPPGTETEPATSLNPSDTKNPEMPKNIRIDKNIRKGRGGSDQAGALITTLQELLQHFPRYNEAESSLLQEYWLKIITNLQDNHNQFSIGSIRFEMQEWEKYDAGLVVEALTLHLDRYPEKQVAYTRGIMRRMQKEQTEKKRQGKGAYRNGYPEESGGSSNANPKSKPGLPFFDRSKFEYGGGVPDLPGPGTAPE